MADWILTPEMESSITKLRTLTSHHDFDDNRPLFPGTPGYISKASHFITNTSAQNIEAYYLGYTFTKQAPIFVTMYAFDMAGKVYQNGFGIFINKDISSSLASQYKRLAHHSVKEFADRYDMSFTKGTFNRVLYELENQIQIRRTIDGKSSFLRGEAIA